MAAATPAPTVATSLPTTGAGGLVPHALEPVVHAVFALAPGSPLLLRSIACIEHFDIPLPVSNPRLLEMFRDRNRKSGGQALGQMPWAGEFVGKWLTHATQLYRLTQHPTLRSTIETALKALQLYQAADGYLGPFPDAKGEDGLRTMSVGWDPWGHYHIMYGCLLWHDATGSAGALGIATEISHLMTTTFPGSDPTKFFKQGSLEQNMAILHSMACLYSKTRDAKLQVFCEMVIAELQIPPAGDYIRNALKKQEFYKGSQPRWEALCGIIGFAELFHATGNPDLAASYQQIWWSLCEYERHNQGGMMSGEAARGDPYSLLSEETCCTVTWGAMCVEMLKMTASSVVADELELSLLNSGLFLLSPSGRWCVYNSMMAGTRSSTTMEISFQAKPGSSELSCCSVNGPRMLGLLAEYSVMAVPAGGSVGGVAAPGGWAINTYAPGTSTVPCPGGSGTVTFTQKTAYPLDGSIEISVAPAAAAATTPFVVWLRIPSWSQKTTAAVNGKAVAQEQIIAGQYLKIARQWHAEDKITLVLDFRLRLWEQVPVTPHTNATAAAASVVCEPCGGGGTQPAPPPKPAWSSTVDGKWPVNGKRLTGSTNTTIGSATPAVGAGPTTMMGWLAPDWSEEPSNETAGQMIPFSCGANIGSGAGKDDCRAMSLQGAGSNVDYYLRGGSPFDSTGIVPAKDLPSWSKAMHDNNWHHLALSDDGTKFSLLLDGRVIATGKHTQPPKTAGGFVVGNWADKNRGYCGDIAGVQFYKSCLSSGDINAIIAASKPTKPPTPKQFVLVSDGTAATYQI
jgi:DUF1680 family protein